MRTVSNSADIYQFEATMENYLPDMNRRGKTKVAFFDQPYEKNNLYKIKMS